MSSGSEASKSLLLFGILAGVLTFIILDVTVAAWWVAITAGLGVICVVALADLAMYISRQNVPI